MHSKRSDHIISSDISAGENSSRCFAQEDAAELLIIAEPTTPEITVFKKFFHHIEEPMAFVIGVHWKADIIGFNVRARTLVSWALHTGTC